MSGVRIVAVIPARMASSRFPGKPLLEVKGLPMIEHVRRRALLCKRFAEVVVATCDAQIAQAVERYGGRCLMTSPTHPAATDRVSEAVQHLACTHVVNVQGDEILILPSDLEQMARAIEADPSVEAWNAVARIEHAGELGDPSIVKGMLSGSGSIFYCARDFSPVAGQLGNGFEPIRKVLGILGYRRDGLERYRSLSRTPLETATSIDQLRLIEHDVVLRAVEFRKGYPGLNEPREADLVRSYLQEDSEQQAVLQEIAG